MRGKRKEKREMEEKEEKHKALGLPPYAVLDMAIFVPLGRKSTTANLAREKPLAPFWIRWADIPMSRRSFGRTKWTPTQWILGVDVGPVFGLISGFAWFERRDGGVESK